MEEETPIMHVNKRMIGEFWTLLRQHCSLIDQLKLSTTNHSSRQLHGRLENEWPIVVDQETLALANSCQVKEFWVDLDLHGSVLPPALFESFVTNSNVKHIWLTFDLITYERRGRQPNLLQGTYEML